MHEGGYLIRMDMIDGDSEGALLCQEPLRSSYDFLDRDYMKQSWNMPERQPSQMISRCWK